MQDLEKRALDLLLANKKEGYSKKFDKHYFYISPDSVHHHQWFWDSCFHAIVMSRFDYKSAIKEIDSLLSCQLEDGFIPHIIFWKWRIIDVLPFHTWWRKEIHPVYRRFTAEIQPPVLGVALRRIFERVKDVAFLKQYLPRVQKYFDYLSGVRDHDEDLLLSIVTPMESGMDLAPQFDLPFGNLEGNPKVTKKHISNLLKKYHKVKWDIDKVFDIDIFNFEDVAFNVIYLLSLEDLSYLWSFVDKEKSKSLERLYQDVKNAVISKFWDSDDKIFYGIYHKNGKEFKTRIKTISSLFPLCLDIPDEYIDGLIEHITNEEEFWLHYPICSVARDEDSFGPLTDTRFIWRGTTWINTNWFIARGLLRHNKKEIYQQLQKKTVELVEKFGFCEFYDPFSGNPGKAQKDFGWSTLVVDLLNSEIC